jgi:GNAT superfamily N-acetyltransferase
VQLEPYLRPLQFRAYRDSDFDSCLAIWRANEGEAFPAGYEPLFADSLRHHDSFYLLGESAGELVCCGGVAYHGSCDCAFLSFGMVAPPHQRRGFGTTLVIARLALLNPFPWGCTVAMEVTPQSFAFYRRFGFQGNGVHTDERGKQIREFQARHSADGR